MKKKAITKEQLVYIILVSIALILLSLGIYSLMRRMLAI
jgi:hypothetical protein